MKVIDRYEYRTVAKEAHEEIVEKKSRFIAHVKPVDNEEDALSFINEVKSKYWDATHNVYAYVIGNNNIQRYSDDGEPSGTAGIPVLEIIKKEDLQDVVVVVTRYFGGILLGAGGLVRTYGKSAKEGIHKAGIVVMRLCDIVNITVNYTLLGKIQNEISNAGYIISSTVYEEDVTLSVCVPITETNFFIDNMINITNNRVSIKKKEQRYIKINAT